MRTEGPHTLIYSIATNGYAYLFKSYLRSQRDYARKQGYDYVVVRRPRIIWRNSGHDSAWLKIPLMVAALLKGYRWVVFIDADCDVQAECPGVDSVEKPGSCVYVSNGFSGRPNSGVMIVKNSEKAMAFFRRLIEASDREDIPAEDWAPFENGHFIHYARQWDGLHILDPMWNNNRDADMDDYVRHYSGQLIGLRSSGLRCRAARRLFRIILRARNAWVDLFARGPHVSAPLSQRLRALSDSTCRRYARYFAPIPAAYWLSE